MRNDHSDAETIYGYSERVAYNKNPQTNMLFAVYKYWNLGRRYNRFYVEVGWSAPLSSGDKFTQLSGAPITDSEASSLNSAAPGGPILAAGFSFGMH